MRSTQYASNKESEFGCAMCTALHLVITIDILCIASALVLLQRLSLLFFHRHTPIIIHHLSSTTSLPLHLIKAFFS